MSTLNTTEASQNLHSLIDEATITHKPIFVKGEKGNAVIISEEDWNAISETLNLSSIPGMCESIHD